MATIGITRGGDLPDSGAKADLHNLVDNSTVALTAGSIATADLANLAVSTAKIANDAVDNTKLDLTDDYALTGTISSAGATTLTDLNIPANSGVALLEGTAPSTAAGEGKLYTKDTSGQPELFYREESDGDEVQITSAGNVVGFTSYTTVTDTSTSSETTTSTSYADTTLTTTFTPGVAGLCMVHVNLTDDAQSGGYSTYALVVDGTPVAEVSTKEGSGDSIMPIGMSYSDTLTAAEHTIKVQFKVSAGTATMAGNTTTARLTVSHPSA